MSGSPASASVQDRRKIFEQGAGTGTPGSKATGAGTPRPTKFIGASSRFG
eukprot:CAMPEP_0167806596 /NCGR_PEP_ID=MMETSP0111_2-20121227/21944_1 /TAXON_ID=91324 /ORGANISM="Lotharella globosa, Strain CCCM811" /LENGTH=49 /DNA_ID= /DNA_START= /DNA_END= /DNA_ORIENTATION=